jgi:hypothetical protein
MKDDVGSVDSFKGSGIVPMESHGPACIRITSWVVSLKLSSV